MTSQFSKPVILMGTIEWEYVGVRYGLSDPLSIQFYTIPRIRFLTSKSYGEVLSKIKKAGWRTNDGE